MPPKKGKGKGKGKGKKKADAWDTTVEGCSPFGFFPRDIILTPLGVSATIIGVKCATPGDPSTARLYAEFQGGCVSPLGPKSPAEFETRGYRRAHSAQYILRDVAECGQGFSTRFTFDRFEAAKKEKIKAAIQRALEPEDDKPAKKDDAKKGKKK